MTTPRLIRRGALRYPAYPATGTAAQIAVWNGLQPREAAPQILRDLAVGHIRTRRIGPAVTWSEFGTTP